MNNIPTAEKFFLLAENWGFAGKQVHEKMIEFAKLHVKAALKEASEKATAGHSYPWTHNEPYVDKDSILNAYSLDNIK
jgi:hypothetical protein